MKESNYNNLMDLCLKTQLFIVEVFGIHIKPKTNIECEAETLNSLHNIWSLNVSSCKERFKRLILEINY